jgi:hypothetical protein
MDTAANLIINKYFLLIVLILSSRVEPRCSILGKGSSCFRTLSPFAGALVLTVTLTLGPSSNRTSGFPRYGSDDLPHGFISNRWRWFTAINQTGTIPAEQQSCWRLSRSLLMDHCISADWVWLALSRAVSVTCRGKFGPCVTTRTRLQPAYPKGQLIW